MVFSPLKMTRESGLAKKQGDARFAHRPEELFELLL